MLLTVKIRLTRPYLGELKPDNRGVRRFKRFNNGVHVNTAFWQSQLQLAARNIHADVDAKTIQPPREIFPASIHLYRRIFSQVRMELFESFRKGTVLTMDFIVREDLPKCPNPDQFKTMLSFVGEYLGLSQFGSAFGFGLFIVENVELKIYESKGRGPVPAPEL